MNNRFILSPFFLDRTVPELQSLAASDWVINTPTLPQGDQQRKMSAIHQGLAAFVSETIAAKQRPVSIAGDCCTAIGMVAGLQHAGIDPYVIWFDAHGDFNTWETTPSGFLGGMPLAMIVGIGEQTMPQAVGLAQVPEEQVILTDARDVDPGEKELLNASRITRLKRPTALLDHPLPDTPLYIHFDVDVIALGEAPAQNYPAPGGPSSSVINAVFNRLALSGQVVAVSVSTWNPTLDKSKVSEAIGMRLLNTLIGHA